jgi:hypothetical protein
MSFQLGASFERCWVDLQTPNSELYTELNCYSGLGTWRDKKISFRSCADSSIARQTSSVAAPQRPP